MQWRINEPIPEFNINYADGEESIRILRINARTSQTFQVDFQLQWFGRWAPTETTLVLSETDLRRALIRGGVLTATDATPIFSVVPKPLGTKKKHSKSRPRVGNGGN